MILRQIVAWLPMQLCYWTGELGFQVCNNWPGDWSEKKKWHHYGGVFGFWVYQTGMHLSYKINDWAGLALWSKDPKEIK